MKRFSAQRQAVLEAVAATKSHPTADRVFETVRASMPRVSLGTVYRNLSGLKKDGLICGFTDANGVEHFDGNPTDHPHFVCEKCGSITDLPEQEPAVAAIEALTGGTVSRSVRLYYGICSRCKK